MPPFVGLAISHAPADAAAGEPMGEAVGVVVTAHLLLRAIVLNDRQTAHFATPMHERGIEQAERLEVLNEGGHRLIGPPAQIRQGREKIAVLIPTLAVIDHLHKTHTSLDETTGNEASGAVVTGAFLVDAIEATGGLRLRADVHRLLGRSLHARCQLVTGDACIEILFARMLQTVVLVEFTQQLQLPILRRSTEVGSRI